MIFSFELVRDTATCWSPDTDTRPSFKLFLLQTKCWRLATCYIFTLSLTSPTAGYCNVSMMCLVNNKSQTTITFHFDQDQGLLTIGILYIDIYILPLVLVLVILFFAFSRNKHLFYGCYSKLLSPSK